ncbi:hypothetical protein [Acidithiobacillus sulfuriphilus]|uniref:hypothetical protein n=1 Tax=Acidithiobacillus sulfuriphilus TaxID=1867749 RepID=UPI003F60F541
MDELDEIAQLEAATERLVQPPPATPSRPRAASRNAEAAETNASGASGDARSGAPLLADILKRLDALSSLVADLARRLPPARLPKAADDPRTESAPEGKTEESAVVDEETAQTGADEKKPSPSQSQTEEDELRKVFPLDEESAAAIAAGIAIDPQAIVSAVEERVTRHAITHHASVVVLIGWALALISAGAGMSWGTITASGRYPFWWPKSAHAGIVRDLAAGFLGAPVGIVLLPIAGYILWQLGRDAEEEKQEAMFKALGMTLFIAGIALPVIALL